MTKHHTKEENDQILTAVAVSSGRAKKTARNLGIPHMTVQNLWDKYLDEATALTNRTDQAETLSQRFLAGALAAQDRFMELISSETSAYRAVLEAAVQFDKHLLLSGRPTSRTEVVRARLIEPGALRALATRIIDVAGAVSQEATNSEPPKSLGKVATGHRPANVTVAPDGADVSE